MPCKTLSSILAPMTTTAHSLLEAEILDRIVSADYAGLSTKELSLKLTSWARRQSETLGQSFIQQIGEYNSGSGGYWEITGAQIGSILRRLAKTHTALVLNPAKKSGARVWQWQPTLDAYEAKRLRQIEQSNTIVVWDRSHWDHPHFLVLRTTPDPVYTNQIHHSILATFHITEPADADKPERVALSVEEARVAAEHFANDMRRSIIRSVA